MNNFGQQIEGLLAYIERNGASLNRLTQNLLTELLTEVQDFISPSIEANISPEIGRNMAFGRRQSRCIHKLS